MTAQLRHSQLFNLLKTESADTNPDNKAVSLDDETALLLLRRAKNSWLRPAIEERVDLASVPQSNNKFFRTVRA